MMLSIKQFLTVQRGSQLCISHRSTAQLCFKTFVTKILQNQTPLKTNHTPPNHKPQNKQKKIQKVDENTLKQI